MLISCDVGRSVFLLLPSQKSIIMLLLPNTNISERDEKHKSYHPFSSTSASVVLLLQLLPSRLEQINLRENNLPVNHYMVPFFIKVGVLLIDWHLLWCS